MVFIKIISVRVIIKVLFIFGRLLFKICIVTVVDTLLLGILMYFCIVVKFLVGLVLISFLDNGVIDLDEME